MARLREFLARVPRTWRAALEFRHASWFTDEVYDALRGPRRRAGGGGRGRGERAPLVPTATWGYLRLRRSGYADGDLAAWAERIRAPAVAGGVRLSQARGGQPGRARRGGEAGGDGAKDWPGDRVRDRIDFARVRRSLYLAAFPLRVLPVTQPAEQLDSPPPDPLTTTGADAGQLLDHRPGIGPRRSAPRLHRGPDRPRDPAARRPDGARGGAGERLRGRRHLLGLAASGPTPSPPSGSPSRCSPSSTRSPWDSASAPPRWSRAGSARRTPRAPRAPRSRRWSLALIVSVVLGTAGALLAPRLLALMGASPAVIATGRGYATIMLGGEAAIIVLFVVQRDLPRRGRRGDRHAGALAGEHHQHRAGPAAHLRRRARSPRSASPARRSRRRSGVASARSTRVTRLFRQASRVPVAPAAPAGRRRGDAPDPEPVRARPRCRT